MTYEAIKTNPEFTDLRVHVFRDANPGRKGIFKPLQDLLDLGMGKLTTEHSLSSYGIPVLVVGGHVYTPQSAVNDDISIGVVWPSWEVSEAEARQLHAHPLYKAWSDAALAYSVARERQAD